MRDGASRRMCRRRGRVWLTMTGGVVGGGESRRWGRDKSELLFRGVLADSGGAHGEIGSKKEVGLRRDEVGRGVECRRRVGIDCVVDVGGSRRKSSAAQD